MYHWYVHKGQEFLKLVLKEGNCSRFRVNIPPQDFIDAGPVALPCQKFLTLTEYLESIGSDENIYLRERNVPSKNQC